MDIDRVMIVAACIGLALTFSLTSIGSALREIAKAIRNIEGE